MPIQLHEIDPKTFPFQTEWEGSCHAKRGCEHQYVDFLQDVLYPIERRGKTLITSGISCCVFVLIKFHRTGGIFAAHLTPEKNFFSQAESLVLPKNEEVSAVVVTQSRGLANAYRKQKEIMAYFESLTSIEIIVQNTNGFHLSVMYDQKNNSLYLAYTDETEHVLEVTPLFNQEATLCEQQAIEELAKIANTTIEKIKGLDSDQQRQLQLYRDVISCLVEHISFDILFAIEEGIRTRILDHAEQFVLLLQIDPDFLENFLHLNWGEKYHVFNHLDITAILLTEIKALPSGIEDKMRVELYSKQYEVNLLIEAQLPLSEFIKFDLQRRQHLLSISLKLARFAEMGLKALGFMALNEDVQQELLNHNHDVARLFPLGLSIEKLIELDSQRRVELLTNAWRIERVVHMGMRIVDFMAIDLTAQRNLLRLDPIKMQQLIGLRVSVSEVFKLTPALQTELLSKACDVKILVEVGMCLSEIVQLDPALRAELLSKADSVKELVKAGIPLGELIKLNTEIREELYQVAYSTTVLLEKIKALQSGRNENSSSSSAVFFPALPVEKGRRREEESCKCVIL